MEINSEKKLTPQERADLCLIRYQKKYPNNNYISCIPVPGAKDEFVLRTEKAVYDVKYDEEKDEFDAKLQHPIMTQANDDKDWEDLPKGKAGMLPMVISLFAVLALAGSLIVSFVTMNFVLLIAGVLSSSLLFAASSIVRSLRRIESYTYLIAQNSQKGEK